MRILGEWLVCEDGVVRPMVEVRVRDAASIPRTEQFLIDTGADRSVFSRAFLDGLRPLSVDLPTGLGLVGIGGGTSHVLIRTAIELIRDDGVPVPIRGEFAAFTDPQAIDFSILGRDVLDNFDVILSRRRDEVLLLAPVHHYQVVRI